MAVEKVAAPVRSSSAISRFQKIVLGWDYLQLLRDSTREKDSKDISIRSLQKVKNSYRDFDEYIGIFEPLLFEEVKAQIVQVKDEEEAMEWERGVVDSCDEAEGLQTVSLAVRDEFRDELSENDLLLLSTEKFQEGAPPNAYAFALVEHRGGREMLSLRTFLLGEIKDLRRSEVESCPRLLKMHAILKTRENFLWILKVCSLSTIMREFLALHSVATLPFKDLILSASEKSNDRDFGDRAWNVPRPLLEFLENNLNESQLGAIHAGLSQRTFVLIQGPPGTGKTQTILGLLSAVLHAAPAKLQSRGTACALQSKPEMHIQDKYFHWTRASPWLMGVNPRDLIMPVDGDDCFFPTGNELKPEVVSNNRKYRIHVLVCAPSNSALDEIVLRVLQTGIHDESDHVYNPKIVRIGLKPHHSVKAVSMDYLVEQKLAGLDHFSGSIKPGTGGALDRDRIRSSILDEAAIVFSTLSFSGSTLFSKMKRVFDVVIIDEAAQAVEPATLIPLAHGCRQVFLVGDPVQLPATVISPTAERFGYGTSLFKRFQGAGFPVQMLKTQYRMHPEISIFPSKEFYNGSLEDGDSVKEQTQKDWHEFCCFGPFCFFDIDGTEMQPSGSGSWVNEDEVEFIILLYHKLVNEYTQLRASSQLAIISPYRHQVKLLREHFRATWGERSDQLVDINTVDGFQGREKEVAIFSCVRSNSGKGIGFVSDFRRMNVGITRARSSVLVVGSASTLMQDEHWSNLVNSAKERNCYFRIEKPYASFFNDPNLEPLRVRKKNESKTEEVVRKLESMVETGAIAEDYGGGNEVDDMAIDDDYGGNDD